MTARVRDHYNGLRKPLMQHQINNRGENPCAYDNGKNEHRQATYRAPSHGCASLPAATCRLASDKRVGQDTRSLKEPPKGEKGNERQNSGMILLEYRRCGFVEHDLALNQRLAFSKGAVGRRRHDLRLGGMLLRRDRSRRRAGRARRRLALAAAFRADECGHPRLLWLQSGRLTASPPAGVG